MLQLYTAYPTFSSTSFENKVDKILNEKGFISLKDLQKATNTRKIMQQEPGIGIGKALKNKGRLSLADLKKVTKKWRRKAGL